MKGKPNAKKLGFYQRFLKRPFDIILSLSLLVLVSPLFITIAVLIRLRMGSKILYKQSRPGWKEKIFTIYKFRTMTDSKNELGDLKGDKDRLTSLGTLLRNTSLDELPELVNILKGDMSFIGPRPLLIKYLPLYDERQRRRHEVRPGLTGLAQISGRNTLSWRERFELDLKYVENITFSGDLRVIGKTILKVLMREGIHSDTAVTMEEFEGNDEKLDEKHDEKHDEMLDERLDERLDEKLYQKLDGKNKRLIIVGASGHGRSAANVAIQMKKWDSIAFLDDNPEVTESMGFKVIGRTSEAPLYSKKADFFVAIGNNKARQRIMEEYEALGITLPTLIHPSTVLGEQVTLGPGTIVMAGAIINCCSTIGKGCIINTGATVDHDAVIEDYVHISPGANLAGTVRVGKGCWLGIGSVISNNINISEGCIIGAGSVVIKDLTDAGTYVGIPVRRL